MRVYLDTAPVIYAVEQVSPYCAAVDTYLADSEVVRIASDLTRMECRVRPIRDNNQELLRDYDDFFDMAVHEVVSLSRAVLDKATDIRARYNLKTPDAVHLAAAVVSGCDTFYTNDHRLDRFTELPIEVITSPLGKD